MSNGVPRSGKPARPSSLKDEPGFSSLPNPAASPPGGGGSLLQGRRTPSKESIASAGCLELGRDAGYGNVYHTRYQIKHADQRTHLCRELLLEEMVPCCGDKARRSYGRLLWAFIRSEAFLFSLHMTALVLGVIKEAANYREEAEILHLVHSIIETVVSILMVVIRVVSGWTAFYHVKKSVGKVEKLNEHEDRPKHQVQGVALKRWLKLFTLGGVLLLVFLIASFLCFYFFAHLGWTILTNQFALLAVSIMSSLFMARVARAESLNAEDQHKTALYESVLLLQELYHTAANPKRSPQEQATVLDSVDRFIKALRDTAMFGKPDHIKLSNRYKPAQSLTFNAMMQSMV